MKKSMKLAVAALVALALVGLSSTAGAQYEGESRAEASVTGGVHILNENDTALPDQVVNVPLVATVGYRLTPMFTAEGEFTWIIPVTQTLDLGQGASAERKSPDILAYQANLRADLPVWSSGAPYVAAGLGALTVLSNTDEDRFPQLEESETMFALNFGAGLNWDLGSRWALRGDFRELVAFPSDNANGLSDASGADPIWMERVTAGLAYRF